MVNVKKEQSSKQKEAEEIEKRKRKGETENGKREEKIKIQKKTKRAKRREQSREAQKQSTGLMHHTGTGFSFSLRTISLISLTEPALHKLHHHHSTMHGHVVLLISPINLPLESSSLQLLVKTSPLSRHLIFRFQSKRRKKLIIRKFCNMTR